MEKEVKEGEVSEVRINRHLSKRRPKQKKKEKKLEKKKEQKCVYAFPFICR